MAIVLPIPHASACHQAYDSSPSSKVSMQHKFTVLSVFFGLLAVLATGHAATTKTQEEAKAPARKGGVKITNQQNNSGETPAQRDRRLLRECRGLPNAGACRGYTR